MVLPVGHERLVIGRGVSCGVQVIDRRVSREHAAIRFYRGGYVLEDLESRNGTFLNHQPLVGRLRLRTGDRISVGGTVLVFELDPEDLSREQRELNRVRMSDSNKPQVAQAEKPVDSDTAPIIGLEPIPREMLRDPQHRLRVIYQVTDCLRGELDPGDLLWKIMDIIWGISAPDRGIIFTADEKANNTLTPVLVRSRHRSDDEIIVSKDFIDRCYSKRVALLTTNPECREDQDTQQQAANHICAIICAPLVAGGKSLGVIYLDLQSDQEDRIFTQDDLDLVSGVALQAAIAIQNAHLHHDSLRHQRMEKELEIARQIQGSLLPRSYPSVPGVQFSALCLPARQVGGDYYDFLEMPNGRIGVVVGDASGKGVPAAILVSMIRAAIRAQARIRPVRGIGEIVGALNHSICVDALPDDLATLFMLEYDPPSRLLQYTNAGHVPALLVRPGVAEPARLSEGGLLLGVSADVVYVQAQVQTEQGDVLVLYTDGVTDSHDLSGRAFSESRLAEIVRRHCAESAEVIRDAIYRTIVDFRESNEQFDDLTLLIMKIV